MDRREAWTIVEPLLVGPRDAAGLLLPAYREMVDDHFGRRFFFCGSARQLSNRSNRINLWLKQIDPADVDLSSGRRPNEKTLQRLARQDPETLMSIARAQNALLTIRDHHDPKVRRLSAPERVDQSTPSSACFVLGPASVTPSFYIAHAHEIRAVREAAKLSRLDLSRELFGPHAHDVFRLLENGHGDGPTPTPFAVTFEFKTLVEGHFAQLGLAAMLFSADSTRPSIPLERSRGNLY